MALHLHISSVMKTLAEMVRFARAHGFKAEIVGDVVRVSDLDGYIETASMEALKIWMGYFISVTPKGKQAFGYVSTCANCEGAGCNNCDHSDPQS